MVNDTKKKYLTLAGQLRAISHPIRLAILDILITNEEECVCHMEAILKFRQAYLSQQLMVLREAGIVAVRRDGKNIFYRIDNDEYKALITMILSTSVKNERLVFFETIGCGCPKCAGKLTQSSVSQN